MMKTVMQLAAALDLFSKVRELLSLIPAIIINKRERPKVSHVQHHKGKIDSVLSNLKRLHQVKSKSTVYHKFVGIRENDINIALLHLI